MKYSEVKRCIRIARAFGYGKYVGINHYYKEWRQESGGKIYKFKHHLDVFQMGYVHDLTLSLMKIENKAIRELRKAVITDGLSIEEED